MQLPNLSSWCISSEWLWLKEILGISQLGKFVWHVLFLPISWLWKTMIEIQKVMNQQPGLLHPSLPCSGPCRPSNGQWQHGRGGSLPPVDKRSTCWGWPTQDDSEERKSWCHSGKKKIQETGNQEEIVWPFKKMFWRLKAGDGFDLGAPVQAVSWSSFWFEQFWMFHIFCEQYQKCPA